MPAVARFPMMRRCGGSLRAQPIVIMRKKIVVFVLMIGLFMSCASCLVACNTSKQTIDLVLKGGSRPDFDPLFSDEDMKAINAAMTPVTDSEVAQAKEEGIYVGWTDEEIRTYISEKRKKSAVMLMYNVANRSRKETPLSLMLQNSNAGIPLGEVIMHGFNLKSGDKWYYQLATSAQTDDPTWNSVIDLFAGLLKVAYTSGDGNYYYSITSGSAPNCDCTLKTFPYATFAVTEEPKLYNEEEFKEELHYLDNMHEINNMLFCEEILEDGATITYDSAHRFYRIEFAVDMKADGVLLRDWYALAQKDMQVSGNSISKYNYYRAVMEIWDNGYVKYFKSESDRSAGVASGSPVDEFSYLWVESEIMSILREDERVSDALLFDDTIFLTPDEFIEFYSDPQVVQAKLGKAEKILISVGSVLGVLIIGAIVSSITVNVLVKKGKLPKLAAKREAKKRSRLARKEAKARRNDSANAQALDNMEEATIKEASGGETPAENGADYYVGNDAEAAMQDVQAKNNCEEN